MIFRIFNATVSVFIEIGLETLSIFRYSSQIPIYRSTPSSFRLVNPRPVYPKKTLNLGPLSHQFRLQPLYPQGPERPEQFLSKMSIIKTIHILTKYINLFVSYAQKYYLPSNTCIAYISYSQITYRHTPQQMENFDTSSIIHK